MINICAKEEGEKNPNIVLSRIRRCRCSLRWRSRYPTATIQVKHDDFEKSGKRQGD